MTHTEHSAKAKLATPCTQWDMTFGGRCLKCGFAPTPTCMDCETPMVERKRGGHIVVDCPSCGFSEVVI